MISARAASACESGLWASGATCPPMGLCGSLSSDVVYLSKYGCILNLFFDLWNLLEPLRPRTSSTSEPLRPLRLFVPTCPQMTSEVEVRSPAVYSPILLMIPSALTPGCVRYNLQICSARSLSISRDAAISLTVLPLLANRMTFSISPV